MVQRYDFCEFAEGSEMQEEENGEFIKYEDYAALEAKYRMIVEHFIKAKQYQDSCKPELMNSAIWRAYQGWKK